jgi:hypothetical protein
VNPSTFVYSEFFQFVKTLEDPRDYFAGKNIAVVGAGDSGRAVVRWLIGLADDRAYNLSTAKSQFPKEIKWFGQNAEDCNTFIEQERALYYELAAALKKGLLNAYPKIRSMTDLSDGIERTKIENRFRLVTGGQNYAEDADIVIFTTGTQSEIPSIYSDFYRGPLGRESLDDLLSASGLFESSAEFVRGQEPSLGNVNLAYRILDENIFFPGAISSDAVNAQSEGANNVAANVVSNANQNWRVVQLTMAINKLLSERRDRP